MHCIHLVLLVFNTNLCLACLQTEEGINIIANCRHEILDHIPSSIRNDTTHLIMSNNIFDNLTYGGMLSRFRNLKVLNFTWNYLTQRSFSPDVFTNIRTLNTLDLQRNRFKVLPSPLIRNAHIRLLKLDYNNIKHVSADFLMNVKRLDELTMSHCGIETISAQAFRSLGSKLQRLDLSDNSLETLHLDLKADIFTSRLFSIRLYNNFWRCDCHLKWLREEVAKGTVHWFFQGYDLLPECEEPKSLKHQNWFKARPEKYGCPPELVNEGSDIATSVGADLEITSTVLTFTPPSSVQWLHNDSLIRSSRFVRNETYNSTHLISTLTIRAFTNKDYGLYQCQVNTSFGSVVQETLVSAPTAAPSISTHMAPTIAAAVLIVIALVVLAVAIALILKGRLAHRGKLYMDGLSERSHKSDCEVPLQSGYEPDELDTPIDLPVGRVDVEHPEVKCYREDELESLPADTEYPADDAGCAEYNEFLQTVSTNHSPAYIEPINNSVAYTRTVSPNASMYGNPGTPNIPYVPEVHQKHSSPVHSEQLANHNGGVLHRPNHHVPYTEAANSTASESSDSIADVVVVNRMNVTPSGSPLTFIKEEPNEDTSADLL